ncbi:MAG TPA: DNA primase [Candidatus Bathyarchaeota archaeon]|nr:DNA primase [Candidatus Bathyarchaeota archaeon]
MTHAHVRELPTKYRIKFSFEVDGVVERHDIIGAIFGQSEGLFGPDLDLSELAKTGRVGRIDVSLKHADGRTVGTIIVPSALDRVTTAVIAAMIEAVDRVGPYQARVKLEGISDVREERRNWVIKRAKEILREWTLAKMPSTTEVIREVSEALAPAKVVRFGPEGLPAGPDVGRSEEIIIVEGRADVVNLLKCGITNAIAMEGLKVPETIIRLCDQKEATAFLDGDHMGEVLLKELLSVANVKYVARAPRGREVEELTPKEVLEALAKRVPAEEVRREIFGPELDPSMLAKLARELHETFEAVLLDGELKEVARIPVHDLFQKLKELDGVYAVVFDGIITQRILDLAKEKGIRFVVGERLVKGVKVPRGIKIMRLPEIRAQMGVEAGAEEEKAPEGEELTEEGH